MTTDISCILVEFDNPCPECGETLDGSEEPICHLKLGSLFENGMPVCSCGTDFEWTADIEVLL